MLNSCLVSYRLDCYFRLHLYCIFPIDLSQIQLQLSGVASNLKCPIAVKVIPNIPNPYNPFKF